MDPPFKEANAQSADLEDNSKLLKELSVKLEHIIKQVEDIDKKQDTILSRLDRIEGLVNKHEQAIGRLNSDLENVKDSIHKINSKVPQKFNPDVTLVVTNPPSVNESDYDWATGLVYALGGNQGMIMDTYRNG